MAILPLMNRASTRRFAVSLRELLAIVAFVAIGCAAMRSPNIWWSGFAVLAAIVLTIRNLILALVDRGPRQASAIGFAASAIVYGMLVLGGEDDREIMRDAVNTQLPSTLVLKGVYNLQFGLEELTMSTASYDRSYKRGQAYLPIGHSLFAILFGYAGGRFAAMVYSRRAEKKCDPI